MNAADIVEKVKNLNLNDISFEGYGLELVSQNRDFTVFKSAAWPEECIPEIHYSFTNPQLNFHKARTCIQREMVKGITGQDFYGKVISKVELMKKTYFFDDGSTISFADFYTQAIDELKPFLPIEDNHYEDMAQED